MEKLNQNMGNIIARSAQLHDSSVGVKRTLISFGGNDEKIKNLLNQLKEMLNKNLNNQKMKEIKLIDGIPSTEIQSLDESIMEILKALDKNNATEIYSIMNEDIEIEIIKNKLIDELFLAFKYTLINNRYGHLLSDDEMKNSVINYVNKYILIK
jgi:esterase/lipase